MNISIDVLRQVSDLIETAHLVLRKDAVLEFYHHYGSNNFTRTGAVFTNIVNREYCKSYTVLLPGQVYPEHYHRIKQESFFVLYGKLIVKREEETFLLEPGDVMSIERGQNHSFSSPGGAVFEEISTTYIKNDSIYIDARIGKLTYEERKSLISFSQFKEMICFGKS